jgi:hypothetical protein
MKNRLISSAPRSLLRAAACAAFVLCLRPAGAWAANANVDCTGATPGAFTSITSALATLDNAGPHVVNVAGAGSVNFGGPNRIRNNGVGDPEPGEQFRGGVRVARSSVGGFGAGNTFGGNGGPNISCDATSLVHGAGLAGFGKIDCKNIEHEKGPPRPSIPKENDE